MSDEADSNASEVEKTTLYQRVGGAEFFRNLVEEFYRAVERDPVLRPLYPRDLEPGKTNLAAFLAQYWGGPQDYSARRGHPRLRMRHFRFAIGGLQRDTWVRLMSDAVRASVASSDDAGALIAYFTSASKMLISQTDVANSVKGHSLPELNVIQVNELR